MNKQIIMIGMVIGSIAGGYLPVLWGAGVFSITSVLCGGLGGIIGIWAAYRLTK
ncbi:MAG TPA: hypothetical protein VMC41_02825 [Candidatus Nanoarchaeia archaeon]|nr:hypothetical protein [Candidatus Nanoarchaeia archaeon]